MQLLPKANFQIGLDQVPEPTDQEKEVLAARAKVVEPPSAKQVPMSAVASGTNPVEALASISEATQAVVTGASFLKWGRNGKAKPRFVFFDESLDAIVWKCSEKDKLPIGAIPLGKVQDICAGVQTPVLHKVRGTTFRPDKVFSIVAAERTLDLQADSAVQRDIWVAGMKARYKMYVRSCGPELENPTPLPKNIEKKVRARAVYPEKFRSNQCSLASTHRKLLAITALGSTLQAGRPAPIR